MEWIGLKGWKWSKDWRMEGLLGYNGKGMAHYMAVKRGNGWKCSLMVGRVSEVMGACGRVKG